MTDIKPEQQVEIILWDWLKTKSKNVREVYFNNSKNKLEWKYFRVEGEKKKPDLIIEVDTNFGKEYIVVEVKDNSASKNVLDAKKILDTYYSNYINGLTKYFIEEKEIKINHFVVATQSSLKGYLYKVEKFVMAEKSENKSKRYVASLGLIPKREGRDTHQYVREIWASSNRLFEKTGNTIKPSIGILIADEEGNPSLMIKKWIDYLKKPHWSQRWIKI